MLKTAHNRRPIPRRKNRNPLIKRPQRRRMEMITIMKPDKYHINKTLLFNAPSASRNDACIHRRVFNFSRNPIDFAAVVCGW